MIPIIQFDPSSLSIWYDSHLINRMRGNTEIGKAMDLALRADYAALISQIDGINDPWTKVRSATVATAVFHEKRHFLDFVLTNYGAFRLRQFFMVYCNLSSVIHFAEQNGELLVPIQSYLGHQFCNLMGVKPANAEVLALANDINRRKTMLGDDRQLINSRFGTWEMGGEAILEALAHHFEIVAAQLLFGPEMLQKIRADVPDSDLLNVRYQWLYEILYSSGLIDLLPHEKGLTAVLSPALVPICYAALACRLWKQEQVLSEGVYSYLPGYRLASLIMALRDQRDTLKAARIVEIWNLVNKTCKQIFGRSCIEEIEFDIQFEAGFIDNLRKSDPESLEVRAYADFHSLRQRFVTILKHDPASILADFEYSLDLSRKLQPFIVVAASAGELGVPPPDYERLLGYVDPEFPNENGTWWWAALAKDWPQHNNSEIFCLRDRGAWIDIISDAAPFSKLVIDGRNIRTMLGPEIISAEKRVSHRFRTRILVDPRFAFPRHKITAANWYFLTGRDDYRCELTWETVRKPEGVVIDAWSLRLWPQLIDHLLGRMADKDSLIRSFQRDWSPLLLSEEFRELFEEVVDDTSLLVEANWRQ